MKRKSRDYYKEIAEQEKRTSELSNKIDREISAEARKENMIKRNLTLWEGEWYEKL